MSKIKTIKNRFTTLFLLGNFVFFAAAVGVFAYFEYESDKQALYRNTDDKLITAAQGASALFRSDFHDRARDTHAITASEDAANIARLSTFAKNIRVAYVYTVIQHNGKILFTASSATDEERSTGYNLTRYFDHYNDASEELKEVFQTHKTIFAEYTDKWGTFRSVFIPMQTSGGTFYVAAADMQIDDIHSQLQSDLISLLLHLLGVFVLSIPFLTWRVRRLNEALQGENTDLVIHLKQEQERLSGILWGTGAGTWEWDIPSGAIRISPEWASMLGYHADELLPFSDLAWENLVHPHDLAVVQETLSRHLRGESEYFDCEMRLRRKNGIWSWVHTRGRIVSASTDGNPVTMAGVNLEIAPRKETETQLHKLSQAVEQSPISILITDIDGAIEYANATFYRLWGYSPEEVIGRTPRFLKSGKTPADTYRQMWETIRSGANWHGEFINRTKDGRELIQSVNISPIFERDGTISHYMAIEEDITDKKRSEERIHYLANFDPLTGLPNRTQLENHFRYLHNFAKRSHTPFAVMFLDLDHFKEINDSLGHKVGDAMLFESGRRLQSMIRQTDIVARMGGDEFVLILSETGSKEAETIAQKMIGTISRPFQVDSYTLTTTASVGIALYPDDGASFDILSKNADTAMYRAKKEGRNTYRFFTEEMQQKSLRALRLGNALRSALPNGELRLVYQPQLSLHSGTIVGAEALIRWDHPEFGAVSPAEFIPIAEENGQILPIGEWVLRTAVAQVRQWIDHGYPPLIMSVNLSAVQFRHHDLPNLVSRILNESGVPPEYLELELTETMAMHDPKLVTGVMNNLHQRGVRMSIDDFGTGYSSLSYLKRFQVYKLKIDRSFVRDISTDPDDKAIVGAIIHMAQSLGLKTIAEGVETLGQLEYLREQGCDEIQGYYYSRPLDSEKFEEFMRSKSIHPKE